MEKTAIEDVRNEPNPLEIHEVRRPVSSALGTEHFAMNYFELAPGDSFSGGLHRHDDQEEVFYVEAGTAVFEVGVDRERVVVEAGELVRFAPGEFQEGYNDPEAGPDGDGPAAADRLVGWALGAPGATHDWDALYSRAHCPDCDAERTHDVDLAAGLFELTCTECGATQP